MAPDSLLDLVRDLVEGAGRLPRRTPIATVRARVLRSAALIALMGLGVGCGNAQKPPRSPEAPADTMGNVLFGLAMEQLTSPRPAAVEQVINCEVTRLRRVLGRDSSLGVIHGVDRRVKSRSTSAQRERVLDSLALKQFVRGQGCDTLAVQGRLGGPFPADLIPQRLPGDTLW